MTDINDIDLQTIANQPGVLTPKQHEIWVLHEKGMSQQAIGYHLDIARETVRNHLTAATRNIQRHIRKAAEP